MSSPEFVHFSKTRKPLATIENLAALFKHADFKIMFLEESCETQSFLADKHIHTFYRRPDALLGRFLKDNAHLISLCNQYELPPAVLKLFLCEVLKTYPVKIVPLPIVQKTPPKAQVLTNQAAEIDRLLKEKQLAIHRLQLIEEHIAIMSKPVDLDVITDDFLMRANARLKELNDKIKRGV